MERKELLSFIKEHENLKQLIAEKEGKNYTNLKTNVLAEYVDKYNNNCNECALATPITMFIVALEEEGILEHLVAQLGYVKK